VKVIDFHQLKFAIFIRYLLIVLYYLKLISRLIKW